MGFASFVGRRCACWVVALLMLSGLGVWEERQPAVRQPPTATLEIPRVSAAEASTWASTVAGLGAKAPTGAGGEGGESVPPDDAASLDRIPPCHDVQCANGGACRALTPQALHVLGRRSPPVAHELGSRAERRGRARLCQCALGFAGPNCTEGWRGTCALPAHVETAEGGSAATTPVLGVAHSLDCCLTCRNHGATSFSVERGGELAEALRLFPVRCRCQFSAGEPVAKPAAMSERAATATAGAKLRAVVVHVTGAGRAPWHGAPATAHVEAAVYLVRGGGVTAPSGVQLPAAVARRKWIERMRKSEEEAYCRGLPAACADGAAGSGGGPAAPVDDVDTFLVAAHRGRDQWGPRQCRVWSQRHRSQCFGAPRNHVARCSGTCLSPPPYRVQSGDTLGAIADAARTTLQQVLAWNPGIDPGNIEIGQVIQLSTPKKEGASPTERAAAASKALRHRKRSMAVRFEHILHVVRVLEAEQREFCSTAGPRGLFLLLTEGDFEWCPDAMQHVSAATAWASAHYSEWSSMQLGSPGPFLLKCEMLPALLRYIDTPPAVFTSIELLLSAFQPTGAGAAVWRWNLITRRAGSRSPGDLRCYDTMSGSSLSPFSMFDVARCVRHALSPCGKGSEAPLLKEFPVNSARALGNDRTEPAKLGGVEVVRLPVKLRKNSRVISVARHHRVMDSYAGESCDEACGRMGGDICREGVFRLVNDCAVMRRLYGDLPCEIGPAESPQLPSANGVRIFLASSRSKAPACSAHGWLDSQSAGAPGLRRGCQCQSPWHLIQDPFEKYATGHVQVHGATSWQAVEPPGKRFRVPVVVFADYREPYLRKTLESIQPFREGAERAPCIIFMDVHSDHDYTASIRAAKSASGCVLLTIQHRTDPSLNALPDHETQNAKNPRLAGHLTHHWYWVQTMVFQHLPVLHGYDGAVLFLEADTPVAPDARAVVAAMVRSAPDDAAHQRIYSLGGWGGENFVDADPKTLILHKTNQFPTMGYAFNRSVWQRIASRRQEFESLRRTAFYSDWSTTISMMLQGGVCESPCPVRAEKVQWTDLPYVTRPPMVVLSPTFSRIAHIGKVGVNKWKLSAGLSDVLPWARPQWKAAQPLETSDVKLQDEVRDWFGFRCHSHSSCTREYEGKFPPGKRHEVLASAQLLAE